MAEFSVRKPYTVFVAVVLVIILGVVSLTKMTTDLLPNITLPYVIVMTSYPGASPETVETVITKPVEAAMATISNIEGVSSTSAENYSMVILEFAQSANMDSVSLEIRESLDQIKSYWDDTVGNPIIMKLNPNMLPVMVAAVGVEGMEVGEISEYTSTQLLPRLESIEGVASATASGLLEESVHVIIREDKIAKINEQVFDSIDKEMEDAREELEEGAKELEKSEKELAEGWNEIEANTADLEKAKQELADGKKELAGKKSDLQQGKEELNKQKDQATKQIAENYTKVIDAKTELVAGKATLNANIMQLEQQLQMAEAKAGLEQALQALNGLKAAGLVSDDTTLEEALAEGSLLPQEVKDLLKTLMTELKMEASATIGSLLQIISVQLSSDSMANVSTDPQMLTITKSTLKEMKKSLAELTEQEEKLDEALTALTKGEMEAATGFGSAEAQMTYGEAQLQAAEGQLESSEEQLDSGFKQIDSAKEQLKDAGKQLEDAKQQLEDGRVQLDEAREEAFLSADMEGVLTVDTVKALLTAQNFSMPGGYLTEEGVEYLVRIGEKPESLETLTNMPIMNLSMEGVDMIRLGDVADVFLSDNSKEIYTNVDGSTGVMISMQKQTGYSTGEVSDKLKDTFRQLMEENPDLKIITLMDQGIYIDLVMDSIFSNIVMGFGLAIIILILFLKDFRPTLVIAISIPISLVTAIVCMYFSKVTLNVISLSGLALGIGMLVDNSIVVIENIYRLRSKGLSRKEASIQGTKEVAGAIAASTLTTVCVFLPIVFTEGITRQLFVDMGLTIGYSLLASLVIAITVVPSLSSKVLTGNKDVTSGGFSEKLGEVYEKILATLLNKKLLVLLVTILLFATSIVLSLSRGTAFMPEMDSNQLTVTLNFPKENTLAETAEETDEIVGRLLELEDVENIGAMLNSGTMSLMGGTSEVTNSTVLYITTKEDKQQTNGQLGKEIEDILSEREYLEVQIQTTSMDLGALSGSGISIMIKGRELDTLQETAIDIAKIVEGIEGTAEVSDGREETTGEIRVLVDTKLAMEHGLTVAQIFNQLYAKLAAPSGSTILSTPMKEYDVVVINEKDESMTEEDLKNTLLDTTDKEGKKKRIALSEIAEFTKKEGLSAISRDQQSRYITVSAQIADGYNVGIVSAQVEEALKDYQLPQGYYMEFTGENETIMDAMEQLMLMLLLAIAFMYLIMVAQFQSFLSPFIIMFTIPLAFTGGFLALYLTNSEVSVIAVIGFVMLSGIIVNNGIVMVDYTNQLREEGMEKREAILLAGKTRLRPVLMTALTTIFGLLTMAFAGGMGADLSRPMALVTIGGLSYGTLLTLIVIPCIYDIFHRERKRKQEA